MAIRAEILAHSQDIGTGREVVTFLLTYHRFIHAEVMTYRVFNRNAASSRAMPVKKTLWDVWSNPAVPVRFGKSRKGMQDGGPLPAGSARLARFLWLMARYPVLLVCWCLLQVGVHKQFVNRLLEPWSWMTLLVTATQWENFYRQRCHASAQPEIRELAETMLRAHAASVPRMLHVGQWHFPFAMPLEIAAAEADGSDGIEQLLKRCTARSARTSYRNFYGKDDVADDLRLTADLTRDKHWSPFEHCCQNMGNEKRYGALVGYRPYRMCFANEAGDSGRPFDPIAMLEEVGLATQD